nr:hypothetical protein [Pandoravirus massiliensis]
MRAKQDRVGALVVCVFCCGVALPFFFVFLRCLFLFGSMCLFVLGEGGGRPRRARLDGGGGGNRRAYPFCPWSHRFQGLASMCGIYPSPGPLLGSAGAKKIESYRRSHMRRSAAALWVSLLARSRVRCLKKIQEKFKKKEK